MSSTPAECIAKCGHEQFSTRSWPTRTIMAQIFGEPGRNAAEESHKRTRRFLLVAFLGIAVLSAIWGFALGSLLRITRLPWLIAVSISVFAFFLAFLIGRWATKKMDAV